MKISTILQRAALASAVSVFGVPLLHAYNPTLYERVSATCGACHSNPHFTTAGDYHLDSGAHAHAGGIVAQTRGIDPTAMTGADPLTALIIQKPLSLDEGSTTLHGGVKLSSSDATMQALIAWVRAGAPQADMNPPVSSPPAYYSTPGGDHSIFVSVRSYRRGGFRDLTGTAPGGNIYRIVFDASSHLVGSPQNLTNFTTDDAAGPAVSLDGTKVAFARKQSGQPWQIWQMNYDGSSLQQITTGAGDKVQPFFLPYQADGTPARAGEGGVGFVSNKAGFRDEYEASTTMSLYVCDATGNNLRQIDFNPSHDAHPWLHSSGVLIFTRWEHNEHQGHNFMPLFGLCASDVAIGGTNLFGAYGEHFTSPAGNSLHESSESNYSGAPSGYMLARGSDRDDAGGSVVGFFNPRLEGEAGSAPQTNVILTGDNDTMKPIRGVYTTPLGYTFRYPRSLLNDSFVVSRATLTAVIVDTDTFNLKTTTMNVYGNFELYTFQVTGTPSQATNLQPLFALPGYNVDEAVPDLVKPTPPRIGKPVDLTKTTGFFTSGKVTQRQSTDGQSHNFTADQIASIRFIRALQFSQGTVNTGRKTDDGIATQILGDIPVASDGSFFAEVPAQVPIQFQLIGKNGQQLVTHKPWVQVAPGETMRCVGCHAGHSDAAAVQTLVARELPAQKLNAQAVRQFHFNEDIQPILTAKCVQCHDSAKVGGAAGRSRALSLTSRFTPANRTEAFESLVGIGTTAPEVKSQDSANSALIWWMTGKNNGAAYPTPADKVAHPAMLTPAELTMIEDWINTGVNFRVVDDHVASKLNSVTTTRFLSDVWPIMKANCVVCHGSGGVGTGAMNFDKDIDEAENQDQLDESRMEVVSERCNFMIPDASLILRKPLAESLSGLSHVGGKFFTDRQDPQYLAIYNWIVSANPALAPGVVPTDLVHVANYPNPFRDKTNIVYGLTGNVVAKITLQIFSENGKMIRELTGPANTDPVIGWNKVEWDGKDKFGHSIGNDVYFYLLKADFGDGTKKTFKGKCVKVN